MFRGSLVYLAPIFILLVLALGVHQFQRPKDQTLGVEVGPTVTPLATFSPTSTPSPSPTIMQKSSGPSSSPNVLGEPSDSPILDWKYPGSRVLSFSNNELVLESDDNSNNITSWYKNKIQQTGMSVKTFVTTTNNGNVLNKLSGASGSLGVMVEISKSSGNSTTKISIKL